MAKVYGIHQIMLSFDKEGKEEEFERFMADELAPEYRAAFGVDVRLIKGVRGDRIGRYVMLFEFPSVEVYTRFFPLGPGPFKEELQRLVKEHQAIFDKFGSFVADSLWTDYLETGG